MHRGCHVIGRTCQHKETEAYVHTANDDGHLVTAPKRYDESILFDKHGDPVRNTRKATNGFSFTRELAIKGSQWIG